MTEFAVGDRVEVRIAGGWKSGWLDATITQINPIKAELDCDGYIVSGGNPKKDIRKKED